MFAFYLNCFTTENNNIDRDAVPSGHQRANLKYRIGSDVNAEEFLHPNSLNHRTLNLVL